MKKRNFLFAGFLFLVGCSSLPFFSDPACGLAAHTEYALSYKAIHDSMRANPSPDNIKANMVLLDELNKKFSENLKKCIEEIE